MIIDAIKQYFEKCPLVSGKRLSVNCLGEKSHSCTIEPTPSGVILQKYTDGGSLRQYPFVFATREYFDKDMLENLKTASFYEQFAAWIEQQNDTGNFPELEDGLTPIRFEILSSGYLYDVDAPKARYQIQLRLIYEKE